MANVIITMRVMPESPEEDLGAIEVEAKRMISEFGGNVGRVDKDPIGFGLVALKLLFVMSEDLGSTDDLESQIATMKSVGSVEVVDVRRAIG